MNFRGKNKVIYIGLYFHTYTKKENYEAFLIFAEYCMRGSRILLKEINKKRKIKDLKKKRTNNVNNEEQMMKWRINKSAVQALANQFDGHKPT